MHSWVPDADASAFPLGHLPLGVRRRPDGSHAAVTRIGERVADLRVLAEIGLFDDCGTARTHFARPHLNALLAEGPDALARVRTRLQQCLAATPTYYDLRERREIFLLPQKHATLVQPIRPGDLTLVTEGGPRGLRASSLLPDGAEIPRLAAAADGTAVTGALAFVVAGDTRLGRGVDEVAARALLFGAGAVLCFRESDTPAAGLPYACVLSAYLTPLAAYGSTALSLTHAPYRERVRGVATVRPDGVLATAARALAQLSTRGARFRTGDLIAVALPELTLRGLAEGDVVTLTTEGDTGPAPASATLTPPLRA